MHPGEYVKVWKPSEVSEKTPAVEESGGGGDKSIVFAPTFQMMDSGQFEAYVEQKMFPQFLQLLNTDKNDARTRFRKAVKIE